MRRGTDPRFIHVAADGLILTPERRNREQSAVVNLDPTTRTLGVNLSADYCAEHEWGIKGLYEAFGVKHEIGVYGLKKRKISKVPDGLVWVELIDGRKGFAYRNYWYSDKPTKPEIAAAAQLVRDNEIMTHDVFDRTTHKMKANPVQLACAWCDNNFGCVSKDPTDIKYLREIYEQFQKKNIVFTFSSALPAFENSGLIIAIADRLPKEVVEMWEKADKDNHEVEKYVVKSGIREILEKAGKRYYALSPRRDEDGSIRFWLNPYEQQLNRAMWCTLDDLKLWTKNEGPIPFTPAEIMEKHERYYGKQSKAVQ